LGSLATDGARLAEVFRVAPSFEIDPTSHHAHVAGRRGAERTRPVRSQAGQLWEARPQGLIRLGNVAESPRLWLRLPSIQTPEAVRRSRQSQDASSHRRGNRRGRERRLCWHFDGACGDCGDVRSKCSVRRLGLGPSFLRPYAPS